MADRLAQLSSSAASLMSAPEFLRNDRISDNIEDVRGHGTLDTILAEMRSLPPYLSMYAQDVVNRLGDKPSDELMARKISEIGNLLPQQEIPRFGPYEMPRFAGGGSVDETLAQYDSPDTYLTDGKRPSVSAPLSDKIDLAMAILRNYGRSAMRDYGVPPWGQAIGDLGMEVALSPATSASSLSKVMAAPVDWLTGREVAAEPMDVLYALPTAAGAVGRVLGPALHMRGAAKAQRDANDFLAARRAKEDLPYDLHIKKLLDDMVARTKWD